MHNGRNSSKHFLKAKPFASWSVRHREDFTPGTPPERIKIFPEAYARALNDPELLVETEKAKMEVDHTPGSELEDLIKKVMDQPKEVMDRVKKMLAN